MADAVRQVWLRNLGGRLDDGLNFTDTPRQPCFTWTWKDAPTPREASRGQLA